MKKKIFAPLMVTLLVGMSQPLLADDEMKDLPLEELKKVCLTTAKKAAESLRNTNVRLFKRGPMTKLNLITEEVVHRYSATYEIEFAEYSTIDVVVEDSTSSLEKECVVREMSYSPD